MSFEVQILLRNAMAHIQNKELALAEELLLKASKLDPKNPDIYRFQAVVAALKFDYRNALSLVDQSILLAPNNGVAHSNRGNILKELGRYDDALIALDKAIELNPNYAEAYSNKGNVLQDMHRYEEAIVWYDKAIALQPNYAEAYSNKGNALAQLQYYEEALRSFDNAIGINPNYADAYWNKASVQLHCGDFIGGWENYESRWFIQNPIPHKYAHIARLDSIHQLFGKRVLVWAEQGLGDGIQFCRYIELLAAYGPKITLEIPESLIGILDSITGFCTLTSSLKNSLTEFDCQVPLLSLPRLFKTTLLSIPAKIPYLQVNNAKQCNMKEQIAFGKRLKVGIVWNGGFRKNSQWLWLINQRRNIALDQIAQLQDVVGVDFYSLQKGDPAESELRERHHEVWSSLIDCAPYLNDFSDTAALMECLDLIISVDTSSAHLAGALGRPVWILNRYDSCWRWLHGRTDSPWYPTAKIYQQSKPGDWDGVIEKVRADLMELATHSHKD